MGTTSVTAVTFFRVWGRDQGDAVLRSQADYEGAIPNNDVPAIAGIAGFGEAEAAGFPAGYAGDHVGFFINLVGRSRNGISGHGDTFLMELDDGSEDPAVRAFTAAGEKDALLVRNESAQSDRDTLVPVGQGFERDKDLLQAGLKSRVHDARHTHASIILHPKIVQGRLGHDNIAITLDTYSHVSKGLQHTAAKSFDEVFSNNYNKRSDEAVEKFG